MRHRLASCDAGTGPNVQRRRFEVREDRGGGPAHGTEEVGGLLSSERRDRAHMAAAHDKERSLAPLAVGHEHDRVGEGLDEHPLVGVEPLQTTAGWTRHLAGKLDRHLFYTTEIGAGVGANGERRNRIYGG